MSLLSEIIPPPFERVTEKLGSTNDELAGSLKLTQEGELLKSYLVWNRSITRDILLSFDQWALEEVPAQLRARVIRSRHPQYGTAYTRYDNPVWQKPEYSIGSQKYKMYPANALKNHISYVATLYATPQMFIIENDKPRIIAQSQRYEEICQMPVPLGSVLCNLYGITDPEELMALGEDPADPLSYFIIKGGKKVIMNTEKLRLNKIYVLPSRPGKGAPYCRITVPTPVGTKQMQLIIDDSYAVRLQLGAFKKKETTRVKATGSVLAADSPGSRPQPETHKAVRKSEGSKSINSMNVIHIIDILNVLFKMGLSDRIDKVFQALIKQYVLPNQWGRVSAKLYPTIAHYRLLSGESARNILVGYMGIADAPFETQEEKLREVFTDQFFPNINVINTVYKVHMLAIMTARLLQNMAGYTRFSNRDHWSEKRIDRIGPTVSQLFRGEWRNNIYNAQKAIDKNPTASLESIVGTVKPEAMTTKIIDAFNNSNWGVKQGFARSNLSDPLEDQNLTDMISHFTKIDVKTERKSKSLFVRGVQPDQWGVVCPGQTTDDKGCGIIKNTAISIFVSLLVEEGAMIAFFNAKGMMVQEKSDVTPDYVMVNGVYQGWCSAPEMYRECIRLRREGGTIHRHTEIVNPGIGWIEFYTDGGRPMRPVAVVEDGIIAVDKYNARGLDFGTLLDRGYVQYIGVAEAEYTSIAVSVEVLEKRLNDMANIEAELNDLFLRAAQGEALENEIQRLQVSLQNASLPYDYVELHPITQMGYSAAMIPFMNLNQAARNAYQAKMSKQGISIDNTNPHLHEGTAVTLIHPTQPLVKTVLHQTSGMETHPAGTTVNLMIATISGFNQEDGLLFNKRAIDAGMFRYKKVFTVDTHLNKTPEFEQQLARPDPEEGDTATRYKYINVNGLPSIGAPLTEGDCVIGKIQINLTKNQPHTNVSVYMPIGEYGIVDDVKVVIDGNGVYVSVRIRSLRRPGIGDKFALIPSQKATIGSVYPDTAFPFDRNGMTPDVIMNPHAIPSRMTMGLMKEILFGTALALEGESYDATGYQDFSDRRFKSILLQHGLAPDGSRVFTSPLGFEFEGEIFSGMAYMQFLNHLAWSKGQIRARGQVNETTHQPNRGKSAHGAIRLGEMELRALLSHGAAYTINERMCILSDAYVTAYCTRCGTIATNNSGKQVHTCLLCGPDAKLGKTVISYIYKYLVQILGSVGYLVSSGLIEEEEYIRSLEEASTAATSGIEQEEFPEEEYQEVVEGESEDEGNYDVMSENSEDD